MDENTRPCLGCVTSTKEVKQYPFGKRGAGAARGGGEGPGKVRSGGPPGAGDGERQREEGWGTGPVSVPPQRPSKSVET